MVGKSQSAPKPAVARAPQAVVAAKKKKTTKKEREARAVKQYLKEKKEEQAYAKGLAKRAAEASAYAKRRRKMFDRVMELQHLLGSMTQHQPLTLASLEQAHFVAAQVSCPECGYVMNEDEVMRGFSADPLDFYTTCPHCTHRFASAATLENQIDRERFVWMCPPQTREAHAEWLQRPGTDKSVASLCAECPHIAWNALRYALEGKDLEPGQDAKILIEKFLRNY